MRPTSHVHFARINHGFGIHMGFQKRAYLVYFITRPLPKQALGAYQSGYAYFVISSISFKVIWQLFSTAVMGINSA